MSRITFQDFMLPQAASVDPYNQAYANELKMFQAREQMPYELLKQKYETEVLPLQVVKTNLELASLMNPVNIDRARLLSGAGGSADDLKKIFDQAFLESQFPGQFAPKSQMPDVPQYQFQPPSQVDAETYRLSIEGHLALKSGKNPTKEQAEAMQKASAAGGLDLFKKVEPQQKQGLELKPSPSPSPKEIKIGPDMNMGSERPAPPSRYDEQPEEAEPKWQPKEWQREPQGSFDAEPAVPGVIQQESLGEAFNRDPNQFSPGEKLQLQLKGSQPQGSFNLADPMSMLRLAAQTDPREIMSDTERKLIPSMAAMEAQQMMRAADLQSRIAQQRMQIIVENQDKVNKLEWLIKNSQNEMEVNRAKVLLEYLYRSMPQYGTPPQPRASGKKGPDLDTVVTKKFANAVKTWDMATKGKRIMSTTMDNPSVLKAEKMRYGQHLMPFESIYNSLSPEEQRIARAKYPVQFKMLGIGQGAKAPAPKAPTQEQKPEESWWSKTKKKMGFGMMTPENINLQKSIKDPSAKRVSEIIVGGNPSRNEVLAALNNLRRRGISETDISSLEQLYSSKTNLMASVD